MSFFKNFKEDLSQAVNELLPDEVLEKKESMDSQDNVSEDSVDHEHDTNEDRNENIEKDMLDEILLDEENQMDYTAVLSKEEDKNEEEAHLSRVSGSNDNEEVTVITKGTVINGNISSEGSLEVMGAINGDVDCQGKLSILGRITGNCIASEVYVTSERLLGCISSETSVKVGKGAVIIGDISATSGFIAGAIKGNIDVNGSVIIDSSAIIKGNIIAKSIQINNGAIIEGHCSMSYADVDMDQIFA